MLNRMMSEYLKRKQQLSHFLLQKKVSSTSSAHCCLTIYPNEFSLAYTRHATDKLVLELCASYPYAGVTGFKEQLTAIVKQYQLKQINCSWVLAPSDYQLIQTDLLPVAADEFQAAIRWKIKEFLRFPTDDVVIDQFAIPPCKLKTKNKMMVVAAQSSYLQKISKEIKASGLNLSFIDIPELAIRNLMAVLESTNQSHALVYVQSSTIELLITYQQQLYFSRSLEFGWGGFSEQTPEELLLYIEQLAREIQRSFDYYEVQWRQPHPTQVTLAATKLISMEVISQLSQSLALPVQWLNLGDRLSSKQEMSIEEQGRYLPIMGELFRKEYGSNAPAN